MCLEFVNDVLGLDLRPYNARLTREAVAPFCMAWKGQAEGGSGATFAVRPLSFDPIAKGVTATLSRVESIVIRRSTMFNGFQMIFIFNQSLFGYLLSSPSSSARISERA
jgi:hypothetical protein